MNRDSLSRDSMQGNGIMGDGTKDEVLRVEDLHVHYATDAGLIRAAQGVSFSLRAEERLGLGRGSRVEIRRS